MYTEIFISVYYFLVQLHKFLEDMYLHMTTEFTTILTQFVIQVFKSEKMKVIQLLLVGISPKNKKEINEVHDETGLMVVLRQYCSLSEFQILASLAKNMKMADIIEELNQLENKRENLYLRILREGFAESAIEYCSTTGSREVRLIVV